MGVTWTSVSGSGGALSYVLLYSSDGGLTWRVIQLGDSPASANAQVNLANLPGTHGMNLGTFRLVLHDSVLTTEAVTDSFEVMGKPPVATIFAPASGTSFGYGQAVTLEGGAIDLEDGSLDDPNLSWSSSLDGPLGTGHLLSARFLSVGTHQITLTATDSDDQRATASVTIVVGSPVTGRDTTPPVVQCGVPPTAWQPTDVTVACTATDAQSGLANPADASFALTTSVPAGTETNSAMTAARTVCDRAGNCTTVGPFGPFEVDKKPPVITVASPVSGMGYLLHEIVVAAYACVDDGSGVASCIGSIPSGSLVDTSTVGPKTFVVQSVDRVGNASSSAVSYGVDYAFAGFYPPEHNVPEFNRREAGAHVPVKFSLGGFQGLGILAAGFPQSIQINCDGSSVPGATPEATAPAGMAGLSYDTSDDTYLYGWITDKSWAGTCRQFGMELADGSMHLLDMDFR